MGEIAYFLLRNARTLLQASYPFWTFKGKRAIVCPSTARLVTNPCLLSGKIPDRRELVLQRIDGLFRRLLSRGPLVRTFAPKGLQ
jgi:hypothetical protein